MPHDLSRISALILAGGQGTRLATLYPDTPKPMIPVAGEPFLHWLTSWLMKQGIRNFVFSAGYRGEQIEEWLGRAPLLQQAKWQVFRETAPLGTGGGARACLHLCDDVVMVSNGDSLTLTPLDFAAKRMNGAGIDGVIIGKEVPDAKRYGSLGVDGENILTGFHEKRNAGNLINAGIYFFRKSILESFPAGQNLSMERDIIPALIQKGARLYVHKVKSDTPFIDIGAPETIMQAEDFINAHLDTPQMRRSGAQ